MSNLLLYGATSRVKSARDNGVRIGLGSDWAVSGSKNLLGELKVARLASDEMDTGFTDRDLVAMATRDAASILGWQNVLGSLRPGARADLIVARRHTRPIPTRRSSHAAETATVARDDQRRPALRHDGADDRSSARAASASPSAAGSGCSS